MNIRRFVAPDMREVLAAIRAELGADAVMLSTRKVPAGVEVIAAIDYDENLWAAQQERAVSAPAAALSIAAPGQIAAPAPTTASAPSWARAIASETLAAADDDVVESGADD